MKTKSNDQNCRVYTPEDVANILGIGMTSTYALLKKQMTMRDFGVKRIGKVYRIECSSFDRWVGAPQPPPAKLLPTDMQPHPVNPPN